MFPVTIPVLDRLIDEYPPTTAEPPLSRAQSVRILKAAVRRDLEWLLNTRRIAVEPPESLRELNRSLYVYGLPDLTAMSLASPKDQAKLLRALQTAVATFEPRIANVRASSLEFVSRGSRHLRFRLEGLLIMDPAPEHVSFDTVLELSTGEYQVKDGSDEG
jgi:type VI secretion system protein ImpF